MSQEELILYISSLKEVLIYSENNDKEDWKESDIINNLESGYFDITLDSNGDLYIYGIIVDILDV